MSEWALSIFSDIINGRYEAQLPILITTNYADDVLIRCMTAADRIS